MYHLNISSTFHNVVVMSLSDCNHTCTYYTSTKLANLPTHCFVFVSCGYGANSHFFHQLLSKYVHINRPYRLCRVGVCTIIPLHNKSKSKLTAFKIPCINILYTTSTCMYKWNSESLNTCAVAKTSHSYWKKKSSTLGTIWLTEHQANHWK